MISAFFQLFKNPTTLVNPDSEVLRKIFFRKYLAFMFVLFTLALIFDLIVDFKAVYWVNILFTIVFVIVFFLLSLTRIPYSLILGLNILFILTSNQLSLLGNPRAFHVLIYWICVTPLFIAVLGGVRDTIFWSLVIGIQIFVSGVIIIRDVGPYTLTLYPDRFLVGGFMFLLTTSFLAVIFNITQKRIREKLFVQNKELVNLTEEIEQHNAQLKDYNEHLEERVHQRTLELEEQNKQLTEYAFINSHLLRAPLANILGVVDLISRTECDEEQREYLRHLLAASKDLDAVVTKINTLLASEVDLNRHLFSSNYKKREEKS